MLLFVVVKSLDDGGLQAVGWGWSGDLKNAYYYQCDQIGLLFKGPCDKFF